MRFARTPVLLLLLLVLGACPRGTRKTMVPDVPQTGDAQARTRFAQARAKFLKDGEASEAFQQIVDEYPEDPIVPWANLFAGMSAIKDRKFEVAAQALQQVVDAGAPAGLTMRAQLFLGITKNYQGDFHGALELLARSQKAIEGDAERTEYLAAVGFASAATEQPLQALRAFDLLYPRVTSTERAVIVARIEEVVAATDVNMLARIFDDLDDRKGPGMAVVASRLALAAEAAGNTSEAQRLRAAAAPARAAVGLPRTIADAAITSGSGDAGLVGAVVPLAGNKQRVGEAAVAGLGMAAGVSDGRGVAAIEVRTADDEATAALAVEDLAKANVIAIVGPIEGSAVDAAGKRAESLGVPLLSLAGRPEALASGRYVFHMRHSAEARARVLAQRALGKGITTFAVLAPESGYGKSVSAAFVAAVEAGGGTVVKQVTYPRDTKSFGSFAKKLDGKWQAVFVPEDSDRLGLIAPALASSGKVPRPIGTKKVGGGRPIVLLSTAEGLSGSYIAYAGRNSEGALLAPGYYPDDQDPAQKVFLDRFIAAFGRAPGVTEAYAYDAAQLAASAGSGGRGALAAALARGQLVGLTGTIQFDEHHRRADPGVVYTVEVDDSGVIAIRVAK